jgi:hypothetical protein
MRLPLRRLTTIIFPSEAAVHRGGWRVRPEGPTESYQRYGDRGSEDVSRQVPGGCGRNGKVISIRLLTLALGTLLPLLLSCTAEENPLVVAHFALEVPEAQATATELLLPTGHFNLQAFPAFVAATVSARSLESVLQKWPEEPGDINKGYNLVTLEFDLPPGTGQELTAIAFTYEKGHPYTFVPAAPEILDLPEGDTTEVNLELVETATGQIAGAAGQETAEAWLIDLDTNVRLDRIEITDGTYRFDYAPHGRKLAVGWVAADGSLTSQSADIVLSKEIPTANLDLP